MAEPTNHLMQAFPPLTPEQQALMSKGRVNESLGPLDIAGVRGVGTALAHGVRLAGKAARGVPAAIAAAIPAAHIVDWDEQERQQRARGINVMYPPRPSGDAPYYLPPNVGANLIDPEASDFIYRHQGNLFHGALGLMPISAPMRLKEAISMLPHTVSPNSAYIAFSNALGRSEPANSDAEGQPGGFYGGPPINNLLRGPGQ